MEINLSKIGSFFNKLLSENQQVIFKVFIVTVLSIFIGETLVFLPYDYKNIKDKIRSFKLFFPTKWLYVKLVIVIAFVFIIIYNFDSILSVLKSKTAPDWFSAIGTISAVIIALLPQLKNDSDLSLSFSIEKITKNDDIYKGKLEISNLFNKNEKVIAFTDFFYFEENSNKKMSIIYSQPTSAKYKDYSPLPVFGRKTTTVFSSPVKFDFSTIFSNNSTGMLVCQTTVMPLSFHDSFLTYNIYEIENGIFRLKHTFDSPDSKTGQKHLKDFYDLDCKNNVTK